MSAAERAREAFVARFGREPQGIAFAPGRVNLIGEHVDYNDGLVLPMPVGQGTAVAWEVAPGGMAEVHAADFDNDDRFPIADASKPAEPDWRSYCRGMIALAPAKPTGGVRLAIAGDLPRGSGLSSSASLCVALGRALANGAGETVEPTALALAAQQTEHQYAGVACGIMDQMAVAAGAPGHAMLLDCRDLSYRLVAIPQGWAVLTIDSGVTRGLVDGEYNQRRAQCAEAARALGVPSLRDATLAQLDAAMLDPLVERRARHVIGEIERVRQAAGAIKSGDLGAFAAILREGHASLRDLFEVSVPAVDVLVEQTDAILGHRGSARLTGAGFGGSVVVVAEQAAAVELAARSARPVTWVYGTPSA